MMPPPTGDGHFRDEVIRLAELTVNTNTIESLQFTNCRIIGPDEPLKATYVLGMDYRDWKALHEGYDAQRTVMYRKIVLEEGDLLEFFKAVYFFVESLAVIGAVPGTYPETLG